ncbi:MAG: hypothetical protein L0I76_28500 [Pseudonocardia sp.]|nr:hypothetical protein [Pseudonocardia sp.]
MSLTGNASQATQIEQARAVAEVLAAVRYAQENPRDQDRALDEFERSCRRTELAQRAFFGYRRGAARVAGVTIEFAQEAARCWQNMSSGSSELARRFRESEMVAFAWDLEMNTQRRTTFVSPHTGYTDTPTEEKPARELVAVRDIRENNQSAASRVEREMILAVLPTWYVAKGKAWCTATLANEGGGKPIEDRRREIIKSFEGIGVRREALIGKIGAPVDQWIEPDLATLIVIGQAIKSGESTVHSEFRTQAPEPTTTSVTAASITSGARTGTASPAAADEKLPDPGTKAWHDDQHPTRADGGAISRVVQLLNGDCGICEQPAEDPS